jgi:hypothetical protein
LTCLQHLLPFKDSSGLRKVPAEKGKRSARATPNQLSCTPNTKC